MTKSRQWTLRATRLSLAILWLVAVLLLSPRFAHASGVSPAIELALPAGAATLLAFHPLPGQICATDADFDDAVRQECDVASARADQYDTCRGKLTTVTNERSECNGALGPCQFAGRKCEANKIALGLEVAELRRRERERWSTVSVFGAGFAAGLVVVGAGLVFAATR